MARIYIKKICPKCGGNKVVVHSDRNGQITTSPTGTSYTTTCDKCGGKGFVETKLFIEEDES